ncbi:MAG: Flagellar FliJ protein [Pseudomonadota bacterium]|jgi:flagellar FliJ protein
MKRFKFRLEAVETIRKKKEDEALQVLAKARGDHQSAIDFRQNLERELRDSIARREGLAQECVGPEAYAIEEAFISGTKIRIQHAILKENRAARLVERAMRSYLHARRDTRVIETIRENDLQEFRREITKRELKEVDELSSSRAVRSGVEP